MLYFLSALSVMYILLMYYISLLLLPPDGFVLCYIGLLVLTLWCFDDDAISPSPGKGRHSNGRLRLGFYEYFGKPTLVEAEMTALLCGLRYAISLGGSLLWIELDS